MLALDWSETLGSGLVLVSEPEHDGCGEGDGWEEVLGSTVVAGGNPSPVLQSSEHDLDPVAALVVFDRFAARFPTWDARLYPFVFQRISEPIGVVTPIGQQPLGWWQTPQQSRRTGIIADLACGHEEADRATVAIGNGVQLGIHATFGSADQTSALVARPPFFDRSDVVPNFYPA